MAWLEEHPTSGHFKVCFRWGKQKIKRTIKTINRRDAEAAMVRLEENIGLVERGRLTIPADADIATFLLSDGKLATSPKDEAAKEVLTLGRIRDQYVEVHSHGAMEQNSLDTVKLHLRHFVTTLGESFPIQSLSLDKLQEHVDRRSRKKYRGRPLSPITLKKEVATFRACWNWGMQGGKVVGPFPYRGLKYAKTTEKPAFQTWEEIERQIARGGLSPAEVRDLWDCLYLSLDQVDELLRHVRDTAKHSFLYPMFAFAAQTGARRSEIIRCRIADVDFQSESVVLHEKKRAKGKRTTRRVPLSPFLVRALKDWLGQHPGGQFLFCQTTHVFRSKTRRTAPTPITRDEAQDHFQRTLEGSKWSRLRGWHALRHSFASNCAATNVDQRMIDEWMGHLTDEMVRRYRHLFPTKQREAIRSVFGKGE
jgi:integrase